MLTNLVKINLKQIYVVLLFTSIFKYMHVFIYYKYIQTYTCVQYDELKTFIKHKDYVWLYQPFLIYYLFDNNVCRCFFLTIDFTNNPLICRQVNKSELNRVYEIVFVLFCWSTVDQTVQFIVSTDKAWFTSRQYLWWAPRWLPHWHSFLAESQKARGMYYYRIMMTA